MKIKEIYNKVRHFIPLQINFTSKVLLVLQMFFILFYVGAEVLTPYQRRFHLYYDFNGFLVILLSFITLILYVQLINLIFYKFRKARIVLNIATICFYFLLFGFHLSTHNSLDYSVLFDNFGEIFYFESLDLFIMKGRFMFLVAAIGFIFILTRFEKRKQWMSGWKKPHNYWFSLVFTVIAYGALLISPLFVYDDITYFYQSMYRYHCTDASDDIDDLKVEYPYVKTPTKTDDSENVKVAASVDRPHIFLIFVESFKESYVETKARNGKEFTPFYNSLIKEGLYIKKFYSNSIQTAKCKLATMCSILPSFRGKVFTRYPDLNVHSIAHILKKYNYETCYFKAARNLTFDNEGNIAKHFGFDHVYAMDETWTADVDEKYNWGWGVQDNIFYQKYFKWLDDFKKGYDEDKRYFTVMSTISNHARFNKVPEDQWDIFKDPQDMRDDYANSINVTDNYLREFYKQLKQRDYLKNSLIIIMGDHSYPIGEHGNFHNEVGSYEDSFRTPFVMVWKDHIQPKYIDDYAWSEVDVAPSILDLLNIEEKNHFVGESFFNPNKKEQQEIYLVQPYDGIHLCVLKHPYKYVRHVRMNREFLFDLNKDPLEKHNIIHSFKDKALIKELRKGLHKFYINQKLIQQDRIWPKDENTVEASEDK